jgi:hypothetical protein
LDIFDNGFKERSLWYELAHAAAELAVEGEGNEASPPGLEGF